MGLGIGRIARKAGRWIPPALLRHAGQPAALFFHGVEPDTRDPLLQTNHHETRHFRAILSALKRHDFQVLPLEAIDDVLANPARHGRSVFLMATLEPTVQTSENSKWNRMQDQQGNSIV